MKEERGVTQCFRVVLVVLAIGVLLALGTPAHGQDAAAVQACAGATTLIGDLRFRSLPTVQARQRLTGIYAMAQMSRNLGLQQIASLQSGQVASADSGRLVRRRG
jgi:hypothetical protein